MLKTALTGNIGSGKTTVSKVFAVLGVPVYNADENARIFLLSEGVNKPLAEVFGNDIMDEQGLPDRMKLARLVFNDNDLLKKLNAIIHPIVMNDFGEWAGQYKSHPYVILESAIIFENKLEKLFDRVILITAPEEQRISRVMKREHCSRDQVAERIKNQLPDKMKEMLSDFIINNDDNTLVIPQVLDIHNILSIHIQD
jgi:dephospho-CoA kinase